MENPICVLGINETHGATAALLKNGEIVASPHDAIYTFEHSGLEYLALDDFLITKSSLK